MTKRIKKLKRAAERTVRHDFAYDVITFFLILGILYFGVSGAMMMLFRVEAPLRPVLYNSMRRVDEGWRASFPGYDTTKFPFQGGFEEGDMLVVKGVASPDEIAVGDVIIFDYHPGRPPFVHRVIKTPTQFEPYFVTKGDANPAPDPDPVYFDNIRGKAISAIPNLGWLSLSLWWHRG